MSELYASALHLDRTAVKALKITDMYSLHRVVYSLFPDVRSEHEKQSHIQSGIVYADQGGDFHGRKVLIVSDRQPAAHANGQYGDVICKPIADSFLSYPRYRFKVQVNPVLSLVFSTLSYYVIEPFLAGKPVKLFGIYLDLLQMVQNTASFYKLLKWMKANDISLADFDHCWKQTMRRERLTPEIREKRRKILEEIESNSEVGVILHEHYNKKKGFREFAMRPKYTLPFAGIQKVVVLAHKPE